MLFPLMQVFTSEARARARSIYYHLQKGGRKDMEYTSLLNLPKQQKIQMLSFWKGFHIAHFI